VSFELVDAELMPDYYACAIKTGEHSYLIQFASYLKRELVVEYMIHELAHCVHWERGNKGCRWPHGEEWGKAWAAVYRGMVGVR
jgi:hypothetical protein